MPTLYPLLLLPPLLAPLALQANQASEIETMRARQQQLEAETRQLRQRNSEQQRRLQHLEQAIARQRERNSELDSALEKTGAEAPRGTPEKDLQGK